MTCHGFDEFDGRPEDAVLLLPLERLLLETDSPSLAAKGPKVGFQGGRVKVTNLPETKILPPNKWMVGRLRLVQIPFCEGIFSGAMLVLERVIT